MRKAMLRFRALMISIFSIIVVSTYANEEKRASTSRSSAFDFVSYTPERAYELAQLASLSYAKDIPSRMYELFGSKYEFIGGVEREVYKDSSLTTTSGFVAYKKMGCENNEVNKAEHGADIWKQDQDSLPGNDSRIMDELESASDKKFSVQSDEKLLNGSIGSYSGMEPKFISKREKEKEICSHVITVSLRGTTNKFQFAYQAMDMIFNALHQQTYPSPIGGGVLLSVLRGYYAVRELHRHVNQLKSQIIRQFQKTQQANSGSNPSTVDVLNKNRPQIRLEVTGHSLGGALATLFASEIAYHGVFDPDDIFVVTFGQPRIGDPDFALHYDYLVPHTYRVVHHRDMIPHVLLCNQVQSPDQYCYMAWSSFYHHGTEVFYPDSKMNISSRYVICRGVPRNEDTSCSKRYYAEFWYPEALGIDAETGNAAYPCSVANLAACENEHVFYFGRRISRWNEKWPLRSNLSAENENNETEFM